MEIAKEELRDLKRMKASAALIQTRFRGKLARIRFQILYRENQRRKAATQIAAVIRGHICRVFYGYVKRKDYFNNVVIPAAVKIQSVWIGRKTRIMFRMLKYQDAAVLVIQATWKSLLAKRHARTIIEELTRKYKSKLATRLQAG